MSQKFYCQLLKEPRLEETNFVIGYNIQGRYKNYISSYTLSIVIDKYQIFISFFFGSLCIGHKAFFEVGGFLFFYHTLPCYTNDD